MRRARRASPFGGFSPPKRRVPEFLPVSEYLGYLLRRRPILEKLADNWLLVFSEFDAFERFPVTSLVDRTRRASL